jgi:hypothetical protein
MKVNWMKILGIVVVISVAAIILIIFLQEREASEGSVPVPKSSSIPEPGSGPIPAITGAVEKTTTFGRSETDSTTASEFFKLRDMVAAPNNRLYILDGSQHEVVVLSADTGDELFRFGREGQGPGEFSWAALRIRYLPSHGIVIIDNELYRATFFGLDGQLLSTFPLPFKADDLIFLPDSTILVSRFLLQPEFQPLAILSAEDVGTVIQQFGFIVEPLPGLFEQIQMSPFYASDVELFSYNGMTRILYLEEQNRLFYVQQNPYVVVYYDLNHGYTGKAVQVPVPFETEKFVEYEVNGESRSVTLLTSSVTESPAKVDSFVVVPVFSADRQKNYLDLYSSSGAFSHRLTIPPLPAESFVSAATFHGHIMYLLLRDEEGLNWIEKFHLQFNQLSEMNS